jgi:hypothetical protein
MNKNCLTTIAILPLLAAALPAQNPKVPPLLMAFGANGKQMVSYQWKQSTTVIRKGNPAAVQIEEVRFDAAGQPQRITLARPGEKRMGPLMARKAAAIKDDVQDVMRLAGRYANPQELAAAIRKGEIWEGQGVLRVHAQSVLLPGDEMNMTVNGATYLPVHVEFNTRYEGGPVAIAIDYQQLSNGPSLMARMIVRIPQDDIVVNVDSYDFVRVAGPVIP